MSTEDDKPAPNPFGQMVSQIEKTPKKGPGRWPEGSKSKKAQSIQRGSTSGVGDVKHTAGLNYSGDRASEVDSGYNLVPKGPKLKSPGLDNLKGPPPSKKVKEEADPEILSWMRRLAALGKMV